MHIMIADDERLAMERLVTIVKRVCSNDKVSGFQTAEGFITALKEEPADVALLDIEMPEMDGISLAGRARVYCPSLDIIFVTAHSQYALDAYSVAASGYLLKPASEDTVREAMNHLRFQVPVHLQRIHVQTFGNFEIFADQKPISFRRRKAKEILAYLIDQKGIPVTPAQIAEVLFEGRPYERSLQKQMQVYITELISALKSAGADQILLRDHNRIAVVPGRFTCDFYEFLQKKPEAIRAYRGEYMMNYSWAEFTTGFLHKDI